MINVQIDCFAPREWSPEYVIWTGSASIRYKDVEWMIKYLSNVKEWDRIYLPYTVCTWMKWVYIALTNNTK